MLTAICILSYIFTNTAKSELSDVALQCMCRLLVELTHFNFRVNLMTAIVSRLSKKSWDEVGLEYNRY